MRKKKPIAAPSSLSHLTDKEILRLHDPVSRLECELYSRLNSCLSERDEVLATLSKELELAKDDLDNARTAMTDAERSYTNVRDAHDSLKHAAQGVIDQWEQNSGADAVNELRLVMAQL